MPQVTYIHQYLVRSYRFALIECNSLVCLIESFPAIPHMPGLLIFWCTYACKPNKTTGVCSTHKTSMHNPPHNHHNHHPQPSHHGLLLLCFQRGMWGKYCAMCASPRPMCKELLAALAADVTAHAQLLLHLRQWQRQLCLHQCPGHLLAHPWQLLACPQQSLLHPRLLFPLLLPPPPCLCCHF